MALARIDPEQIKGSLRPASQNIMPSLPPSSQGAFDPSSITAEGAGQAVRRPLVATSEALGRGVSTLGENVRQGASTLGENFRQGAYNLAGGGAYYGDLINRFGSGLLGNKTDPNYFKDKVIGAFEGANQPAPSPQVVHRDPIGLPAQVVPSEPALTSTGLPAQVVPGEPALSPVETLVRPEVVPETDLYSGITGYGPEETREDGRFSLEDFLEAAGPAKSGFAALNMLGLGSSLVAQNEAQLGLTASRERRAAEEERAVAAEKREVEESQLGLEATQADIDFTKAKTVETTAKALSNLRSDGKDAKVKFTEGTTDITNNIVTPPRAEVGGLTVDLSLDESSILKQDVAGSLRVLKASGQSSGDSVRDTEYVTRKVLERILMERGT